MRLAKGLRERMLIQLADPDSYQIIASVLKGSKSAIAIGRELNLPSSTLYRKISELKECALLMTDTFVVRPDGRREALYACTFKEIAFRTTEEGLELELTPTERSLEKRWFELFFFSR
jgi:predicted transcriptional regulator